MTSSPPVFIARRTETARAQLSRGKLVSLVVILSIERGQRMIKSRPVVLELLWRAKRPWTAYGLFIHWKRQSASSLCNVLSSFEART